MYRYKEFIQEMNVERQEIIRKRKIEHTHGVDVSMLLDSYKDLLHLSNYVAEGMDNSEQDVFCKILIIYRIR